MRGASCCQGQQRGLHLLEQSHVYACMYVYICVCVCVHTYIYIYTYIHTYIHTYICLLERTTKSCGSTQMSTSVMFRYAWLRRDIDYACPCIQLSECIHSTFADGCASKISMWLTSERAHSPELNHMSHCAMTVCMLGIWTLVVVYSFLYLLNIVRAWFVCICSM